MRIISNGQSRVEVERHWTLLDAYEFLEHLDIQTDAEIVRSMRR